eukprot:TRINITY_DN1951_c0_g1_i2.p1 TRINITY_DN1951_c0_g1~~TRINITY_DN1951_c0_g1_i2.p1  ORF type:complete len:250 (+),score=31.23 TRINITY_DN1951_c0_g1_i2:92-841(+)
MANCEAHGIITFEQILQGALGQEEQQRAHDYLSNPDKYRQTALGYNESIGKDDTSMIDREEMYDMRVTLRRFKNQYTQEIKDEEMLDANTDLKMKADVKIKGEGQSQRSSLNISSARKEQKSNDSAERPASSGSYHPPERKQSSQKKRPPPSPLQLVPPGWNIIKPRKTEQNSTQRGFQAPDNKVFPTLESAHDYWTKELKQIHSIGKEDIIQDNITIPYLASVIKSISLTGLEKRDKKSKKQDKSQPE